MAVIACPNCSESIDDSASECINCGLILAKWRERSAAEAAAPVDPDRATAAAAPIDFAALSARAKTTRPKTELSEIRLPIYMIRFGGALVALSLFLSLPGPWTTKPKPVTTAQLSELTVAPGLYEVSGAEINMAQRLYRVFYAGGSFFSSTAPQLRRTPIGPAPADVDTVKMQEVEMWISDQRYPCIWYVREAGLTSAIKSSFPGNYASQDVTPDIEPITQLSEDEPCQKIAVVRSTSRVGTGTGLLLLMIGGPILSIGLITRFMQRV